MKTVLDQAIEKANKFLSTQHDEKLDKSSCVRVSVYVHQSLPNTKALGISYLIIFRKDEQQQWVYYGHEKHIPSIDYALHTDVEPIIQECD